MINIFEVNETNKMIEQENLDVRTITMGISLLDCIDIDLNVLNQKIYDSKIVYELAHGYFDGSVQARISPVIEKINCKGKDFYENIHKVYDWMEKETERRERNRK